MSTGAQSRFIASDVQNNEGRRLSISSYAGGGGRRICDSCHIQESSWMATIQQGGTNLEREL
jgi:hypothetical protein